MAGRSRGLFVIWFAIALSMLGCGSGGSASDSTVSESSISKAEFVSKANAICRRAMQQVAGEWVAYVRANPDSSLANAAEVWGRQIIRPSIQAQIEDIRNLGAPEGDAEEVEAILTSLQEGVRRLLVKVDQIVEGKSQESEALPVLRPPGKPALQYGVDQCTYREWNA